MSRITTRNDAALVLPFRTKIGRSITWLATKLSNALSKLSGAIISASNAFNVGFLDKAKIDQLVRYSYLTNPNYYDPGNYDYTWEEDIIEPLKKTTSSRNLLVAFCGKGRESWIFARNGYDVTGIDREQFMIDDAIEYAKEKGYNSKFICADFNGYKVEDPYDIVYTSTWMYTTYVDKPSRREFLNKCKELCSNSGVIVISYRTRNNDKIDSFNHLIAKSVAFATFGNRTTAKGDRIENGLFWHYFKESEIEEELQEAGMKTLLHLPSTNGHLEWRLIRSIDKS